MNNKESLTHDLKNSLIKSLLIIKRMEFNNPNDEDLKIIKNNILSSIKQLEVSDNYPYPPARTINTHS